MMALSLGSLAALCWGVHDLCVRRMSRISDIAACMVLVLICGLVFQMPALLWSGAGTDSGTGRSVTSVTIALSGVAGFLFAGATYALYRAFAAGPVRIVAPIAAAYPVISLSLAGFTGHATSILQWLAVWLVIVGVTLVSSRSDNDSTVFDRGSTIAWAALAALCFALTFALGQALSDTHPVVPVLLLTRVAAIIAVLMLMVLTGGLRWPQRSDWPVLAVMGLLDAAALGLVFFAGSLPSGALATVTASLFGVVTILLAWLFLDERLIAVQWTGVALAFAAIAYLASQ